MTRTRKALTLTVLSLLTCWGCGTNPEPLPETPADGITGNGGPEPAAVHAGKSWPGWRGPDRDGRSEERGLRLRWQGEGPKELWRRPIGDGFSGIAVGDAGLFTSFTEGEDEVLFCMNRESGAVVWRHALNANFEEEFGNGPRSTPTLDGNRVYAMGSRGVLHALNAADGTPVWRRDLFESYGNGRRGFQRGYASSPLIIGDRLYIHIGSARAVICLDKHSGEVHWATQNGRAASSSPVLAEIEGHPQIVSFIGKGLHGFDPETGDGLWQVGWKTNYDLNIATPLLLPPNRVFISSGYDKGAAMIGVRKSDGQWQAEILWENRLFRNHFNSSIVHEGHIYGFDNSLLKCIEAETGEERWKARGYGKGSLIYADGHLLALGEKGNFGVVAATPEGFREIGQTKVLEGKCWTPPTLAHGVLYLRDQKELVALDLRPK